MGEGRESSTLRCACCQAQTNSGHTGTLCNLLKKWLTVINWNNSPSALTNNMVLHMYVSVSLMFLMCVCEHFSVCVSVSVYKTANTLHECFCMLIFYVLYTNILTCNPD